MPGRTLAQPQAARAAQARRGAKNRKRERRSGAHSLSALDREIAVDLILRRLAKWMVPALAVSLTLNAVQGVINVGLFVRGPEQEFFQFAPNRADAIPISPLSEPFTPERLSAWTTDVAERLFDFSHADYNEHFRTMRIYFTAGGFASFREMMVQSNWLSEVQRRRAVLRGEVDGALQVARINPEYWDVAGRVHIVLDSPGYEVATDTKQITLRIVRGDPSPPADPIHKPFQATNWIGLRIHVLSVSQ